MTACRVCPSQPHNGLCVARLSCQMTGGCWAAQNFRQLWAAESLAQIAALWSHLQLAGCWNTGWWLFWVWLSKNQTISCWCYCSSSFIRSCSCSSSSSSSKCWSSSSNSSCYFEVIGDGVLWLILEKNTFWALHVHKFGLLLLYLWINF